jgi:competence ComEA-like helix-hairpin-helix protein
MLKLRHWIKGFFGFPRSHVNGFIILLMLTTLMLFSEPVWHWWVSTESPDLRADRAKLDSLTALWSQEPEETERTAAITSETRLFSFDPNKITTNDLMELGFSENLATRIGRYREKGGKFRIKSDLLKIYGVDSAFYDRLYPFILLPGHLAKEERRKKVSDQKAAPELKKVAEKFDLNNADTSQLKKIYGIGDKLSLRILKYRDRLGGFVRMDQLKEVYGLDSLVIGRLSEHATIQSDFKPTKININTASEKQLSSHPYLTKAAKAIVSYRFQHGNFQTVQDIQNVNSVDEQFIQRVIPYLKVNDEL